MRFAPSFCQRRVFLGQQNKKQHCMQLYLEATATEHYDIMFKSHAILNFD